MEFLIGFLVGGAVAAPFVVKFFIWRVERRWKREDAIAEAEHRERMAALDKQTRETRLRTAAILAETDQIEAEINYRRGQG